jgi:cyclophilin family peptidyl-prolyl cis-trans isomerase
VRPLIAFLEETYGNDLQLVFRHFPLSSIHPLALVAAEASEAAAAQGAFWEMHDMLFDRVQEWSRLPEAEAIKVFAGFADDLGLEADRLEKELEDQVYRQQVSDSYDTAVAMGLRGTPTFIVNGRIVPTGVAVPSFIELTESEPPRAYDSPPPMVIDPDGEYRATIQTSKGDIVVELLPDAAPTNVNTFAFLAQDGWYDGHSFFFVEPNVVAYSGDPTNMGLVLPFSGFVCGSELGPHSTFDEGGLLAMYSPAPDRNSGLFFITMSAVPEFNGQFTVIGRVVEGMEVAQSLASARPGDGSQPDLVETIIVEEQ